MDHSPWIIRGMRIGGLKNFLDHVCAEAGREIELIEERRLSGELEWEDYESLIDLPFNRIWIAARAVGYELTSFVESELHGLSHAPWLMEPKHKGPKSVDLRAALTPGMLSELRQVSQLPFEQIVGLVDKHYGISLKSFDGWDDIHQLRGAVNDFKHRDGRRRPKDIDFSKTGFPQFQEISDQQAYKYIDSVRRFLLALDRAITSSKASAN